jgi:hypothetical protein
MPRGLQLQFTRLGERKDVAMEQEGFPMHGRSVC